MSELCANLLDAGLVATCDDLEKVGGLTDTFYIGQKSQLSGYDLNATTGDVEALNFKVVSPAYGLFKISGRKAKNTGEWPMEVGENINTFNHTFAALLYYSTTAQLQKIKTLAKSKALFILSPGQDDRILVWGIELGLEASAGAGGTGADLQDSTAYTLTFSGKQKEPPRYFNTTPTSTLATNLTYLDSISLNA